jgi:lipoprotein-anchoring transpeptidase ErfK/SrfK
MKRATAFLFASIPALLLCACSEPAPGGAGKDVAVATPPAAPSATPAASAGEPAAALVVDTQPLDIPPVEPSASPVAQAIDQAVWSATPATPQAKRDAMIRVQVLLARAHVSPGVIDGADGGNVRNAISAFETAHGLPADGQLNDQVWQALTADKGPAMTDYTITDEDVAGPFLAKIPTDFVEMAKLDHLGFTSPLEALAEKFHMDEALLKALNPGADFSKAGTKIVVAAPGPEKLAGKVTRIEVDKTARQVRAYGDGDKLLAVYPATVGSTERPAPSGDWAVRTLAPNPTYTYDPSRLTFGKAAQGKLTIKAGPNNPVGSTWIDLTKDTYGIHGTPDPRLVGKTASHGCVRLTNWDVRQLGAAVQKGAKVQFLGEATTTAKSKA